MQIKSAFGISSIVTIILFVLVCLTINLQYTFLIFLFIAFGLFSFALYFRDRAKAKNLFHGERRDSITAYYLFAAFGGFIFLLFLGSVLFPYTPTYSFSENVTIETEPLAMNYFINGNYSWDQPVIKGKVLVYDIKEKSIDMPSDIPKELSYDANETPSQLTIFFINQTEQEVGTYRMESGKTLKGYKTETTLVMIYWPEKKVVGKYVIQGDRPNSTTVAPSNAVRISGGTDNLLKWITGLPRQ